MATRNRTDDSESTAVLTVSQLHSPVRRRDVQRIEFLVAFGVPPLERPVHAGGNKPAPVGGVEGHVRDRAGMPTQGMAL